MKKCKEKEEIKKEKTCNCKCDSCGDECNSNENCNCDESCECCKEIDDITHDEEEILILKNTVDNLNNKVKQAQAELINYRKRKDEEVSNMMKFANKDIILEMLPILDNFERALNMKDKNPEFEKYSEGYELIYSHLIDTLKKFGVEEIDSLDHEFNPDLHEAVMISQDDNKDDDIITEVFNKGYTLKGRVIRPSKVRVNKLN
ncbi:MAG: nucleotide exchange factor GrpE [bacterium]|nr:nucleotide exchange factor GrpE [bacterium]